MSDGWILIHRAIKKKAWYRDKDYRAIWLDLLLSAAWEDRQVMMNGQIISLKRGQLITGRKALAVNSKISENKVYRVLKQFESEQQINIKTTNKYSIISITNYDQYQSTEQQKDSKKTTDQQQTNNRPTQRNNINKLKEIKERNIIPPKLEWVQKYCLERQNNINPQSFMDHYESNGWMRGSNKIKNWQACVRTWEQKTTQPGKKEVVL